MARRTFNRPEFVWKVLRKSCSTQWGMLASLSNATLLFDQPLNGFVLLPRARNRRMVCEVDESAKLMSVGLATYSRLALRRFEHQRGPLLESEPTHVTGSGESIFHN